MKNDFIYKQEKLYEFHFGNKSGLGRELLTIDNESYYVTSETKNKFMNINVMPKIDIQRYEMPIKVEIKESEDTIDFNFDDLEIPEHFYEYSATAEEILKREHLKAEQLEYLDTNSNDSFNTQSFELPVVKAVRKRKCPAKKCNKMMFRDQLDDHLFAKHPSDCEMVCLRRFCGFTANDPKTLLDHMNGCTRKTVQKLKVQIKKKCPECGLEVKDLNSHFRYAHAETGLEFFCDHCPFVCNNKLKMKRHVRKHISKETKMIKRFLCAHCPKKFHNKEGIKIHVLMTHFRVRRRKEHWKKKCQVPGCNRVLSNMPSLRYHMKAVHLKE
jgi:hypothetical protein